MRDVFPDETLQDHSAAQSPGGDTDAARIRESIEGQVACPFCGVVNDGSQAICAKCTMENTPVARKATKLRIGPWYVLQNRNPAAPGMKWETLLTFIQKGRVRPNSVVRGPTTHQLWRFAAHVKGLSREFGVCYSCGGSVEKGGNLCPHCNRLQEPPINPDVLLETGEPEAKLPIFKEISAAEVEQHNSALIDDTTSEAVVEAQRKIREQEEALAREQRDAIERDRQAVEQEKRAAAHERDLARMEQEAVVREREALARAKESLDKDRSALSHEREAARRDRDAAAVVAREAANARDAANAEVAAARELAAREAAAKERFPTGEAAATREATVSSSPPTPAREAAAAPQPSTPVSAEPATSVWDLGDHDTPRHQFSPTQGSRTPAPTAPAGSSSASASGQKSRARDGFLSAKDLAAAFKLNAATEEYDIAAKPAEAHRKPEPILPSTFQLDPAPTPPRRGIKRVVGFVVVLGVVAAVALVPDLRQIALNYWYDLTDQSPKPAAKAPAQPKTGSGLPDDPADYHPEVPGATVPLPVPIAHPSATPQTNPSDVAAPRPVSPVIPPSPVPSPTLAPATPPAAAPSPTPVPVTGVTPIPTTLPAAPSSAVPPADAAAQAKALYQSALDAEGRVDFSAAVGFLEQLEKLPKEVWPSDADQRLRLDRVQQSQK